MYNTIFLFRRKPGTTAQQFFDYYENHHSKFGERIAASNAARYVRHYLYALTPNAPEPVYDAMTELGYADAAGIDRIGAKLAADQKLAADLAEDEARFCDRSSIVRYRSEDCLSALKAAASADMTRTFKTLWFARRKAGVSKETFVDFYENRQRVLGEELFGDHVVHYVRHYLYPLNATDPEPAYDAVAEVWYRNRASYDHIMVDVWGDKSKTTAIAAGQEQFMDRTAVAAYRVEVRASAMPPV